MKKINSLLTHSLILMLGLTSFTPQTKAFTDVPPDSWFYFYVQDLLNHGIVDSGDIYRPEDAVRRTEMAKVIIKAIGETGEYPLPEYPAFDDVPLNTWFAPFVERAATLGIINGYKDATGNFLGTYGPADKVTRAQLVKILVEAFDLKSTTPSSLTFADVQSTDWFYNYVNIAATLGLVQGYDGNVFKPNQFVTRSEMAKMISITLHLGDSPTSGQDPQTPESPQTPPSNDPNPPIENPPSENQALFKANKTTLEDGLLIADGKEKFIEQYAFQGQLEGFTIDTLTLVNDITGPTYGDNPQASNAIKTVTLKYPDKNGYLKTASKPLDVNGKVRFSGLDFYVKRNLDTPLEIYVTMDDFSQIGEQASGEAVQLALQNTGNTLNTFKAVGEFSGESITLSEAGLTVSDNDLNNYVVRKTAPHFTLAKKTDLLQAGNNDLIVLNIKADNSNSLQLARLTFEIAVEDQDNANLILNDFHWYKGSNLIDTDDVEIYDATGHQDLMAGGVLSNGFSKVIVSFNKPQTVTAGETQTFRLEASVSGAANDDNVVTKLADGDENAELTGLTAHPQGNTGKIFVSGDANSGIFTASDTDFSQLEMDDKNILWSDQSAKSHLYPTVTNGAVTTDTGSSDWTNGYQLKISALESVVLTK